ncbi:MAG TPA: trypsin-like peptidase domain-containing protein [Burkholderiales bacterium]|nr:trypsin-like peptidase domain-containing protein [Burkholderiales bacterium]
MRRFTARLCLVAVLVTFSSAALALSAAEVFAKNRNAIYMLIVSGDEPGVLDVVAQGSAVLIAPGRFVTNCHVLERGKNFVVSRREDRIIERVLLVSFEKGKDLCELDLAQMKPGFDKPVEIAATDTLHIGETVFAIGSPRGMELTISNGIVSGFREASGGVKLIQTTAPISAGSSGGGLFDDQGRLVGITTLVAKDSQNLNFAISAQYIPSARISEAALLKQRTGVARADAAATPEIAFERQERMRRQEQDTIAARKKQLDAPVVIPTDRPDPSVPASGPRLATARKPIATRLTPYQGLGDSNLPVRLYEQMARKGELTGLDDNAAIRKVYEALIRQHVAQQLRWRDGGNYVSEFQIQLRRSGEVMFVIPARVSGVERFDQEARRAIGAASPFPVPQDNEAFAQMSELTIAVQTPERAIPSTQPAKPAPNKKAK